MADAQVTLVGRSSSHFTRTARIFAIELGIAHRFQPVLDMTRFEPEQYGGNPALKVPVLIDEAGPLFGTENICRALARRSGARGVVLRGEVGERLVANAEELILHAMGAEVILIMNGLEGQPPPASLKPRRSLENALAFLESNVDRVQAALPADRLLSFCETALYCLVTHLPFRKVMSTAGYPRLQAFCQAFDTRPGAAATGYRFDSA